MRTLVYGLKLEELASVFLKYFPVNSVKAMRGCLFAKKENKLEKFASNLFKAYWSEGIDISQENSLLDIAIFSNLESTRI
jgi:predicted DsbA family dithiol-disulfide isomerase